MEVTDSANVIIIFDQSNKENIPPLCNTNKGKIPILHPTTSLKKCDKPKSKRVPLADITNLFNNPTSTATFTLPHQHPNGVLDLPRRTSSVHDSGTLRMRFR
ncbi:hypothetical protein VNO77_37048 [Canavalia gladiata]|uniref:Uncharacterized protein n=1 Tax=Canavalia gladiata TaxID=3824 RepID=A0AAN9K8G5_CANGL